MPRYQYAPTLEIYTDLTLFPHPGCVVTTGTFDGMHKGHRYLVGRTLQAAGEEGLPMAAVTYWPHPRTVCGTQPVALLTTLEEKLRLMETAGVECAVVCPFTAETAAMSAAEFLQTLFRHLHVRRMVIGANHRMGKGGRCDAEGIRAEAARSGVTTDIVGLLEDRSQRISSSEIRKLVAQGDMAQAAGLLGYPYLISGTVVRGDGLGRTIGYPTANIRPGSAEKLLPPPGVYAVRVHVGEELSDGMMYIGSRPTLRPGVEETRIEVNLFGYRGDLYGREIHVDCLARMRGEVQCASLEVLQQQIRQDEQACRRYLNIL
ncbi:MAG: riboflavin biosynthesis protein RibF [Bacteroidales bacterium]|nr:riboflavin biosynthesis protein RibF [Bacteroidales bacterium]MBQ7213598.1 riboflavin biosynthesis protein RibF [Bacteroidales bacterium]